MTKSSVFSVSVLLLVIMMTASPSQGRRIRVQRQDTASMTTAEAPTGPIKSYKSFNVTKSEATRVEIPAGFGSYDFASFEKVEIVDKHNELRRTPAARTDFERSDPNAIKSSDMEHATWDDDLAYMGFLWAQGCDFRHDQPENVSPYATIGQNLWAYTGTEDEPRSGVRATQDWYDEVTDFYYQAGTGGSCSGVCGHYTQVVWATTSKVGCGRYFCPYLNSAGLRNAWYVVCNYAPAGNIYGLQPYAIGQPCTECGTGVGQCYNDLCRLCSEHNDPCVCRQACENCGVLDQSACTCSCPNGYYGSSCSKQCLETDYRCYNTWWPQFCADYQQVREGCPQMCGLCNPVDPGYECRPGSVQTRAPPAPAKPVTTAPIPAVCDIKFTAASYISGVLNIFQGDKVWRVKRNGRLLSPDEGELVTDYFTKLPSKVTAAYELSTGEVVFIRGKKMYTYQGSERTNRETLSSLGLPKSLTGAIHVSWESRTYFFKGTEVFAFNERTRGVDSGYPRPISDEFPGIPSKLTAAFSDASGNKYFIRSKKVSKITYGRNERDEGYPKLFTQEFLSICTN